MRGLLAFIFNLVAFVLFLVVLPVLAALAVLTFIVIGVVWACSGGHGMPKGGPRHHE